MFEHIKELTDNNEHCKAVIELAKLTKNINYINLAYDIKREYDLISSMSPGLKALRTRLRKNCLLCMSNRLSENDYHELYMSL